MSKRYEVICGPTSPTPAGWNYQRGEFDSLELAIECGKHHCSPDPDTGVLSDDVWFEVLDHENDGRTVAAGDRRFSYDYYENLPNLLKPLTNHLNTLGKEITETNKNNGWNVMQPVDWSDTYKVPAVCGLVHTEVSEAIEAFRKDDAYNFEEELADVIIRTLDLGCGLGFDMDRAVRAKMDKNKTRSHRHGGKRI